MSDENKKPEDNNKKPDGFWQKEMTPVQRAALMFGSIAAGLATMGAMAYRESKRSRDLVDRANKDKKDPKGPKGPK